jgi:hypothetical protein
VQEAHSAIRASAGERLTPLTERVQERGSLCWQSECRKEARSASRESAGERLTPLAKRTQEAHPAPPWHSESPSPLAE